MSSAWTAVVGLAISATMLITPGVTGLHRQSPQVGAPVPAAIPYSQQTDGQWDVTRLVAKGDVVPGMPSPLSAFGDGYWLDSGVLLFWGRCGADDSNQALVSWKDGRLRRIVGDAEAFREPDGIEKKIRTKDGFNSLKSQFLPHGRFLYINVFAGRLYRPYAFDGEQFLDIGNAGRPRGIDSNRVLVSTGIYRLGWFDGQTVEPFEPETWRLPGLISGVATFPDAILVLADPAGAKVSSPAAFYRVSPKGADRILGVGDPHPAFPDREVIGFRGFVASGSDTFVVGLTTKKRKDAKSTVIRNEFNHVLYDRGRWTEVGHGISPLRVFKNENDYAVDHLVMPVPGQPDVLFSVKGSPRFQYPNFLDLYYLKDGTYKHIPWEKSVGLTLENVFEISRKRSGSLQYLPAFDVLPLSHPGAGAVVATGVSKLAANRGFLGERFADILGLLERKRLSARGLDRSSNSGIRVADNKASSTYAFWHLFAPDIEGGSLVEMPTFKTGGRQYSSLAGVVAWKSPTEAIVRNLDGFFLLSKTAAK